MSYPPAVEILCAMTHPAIDIEWIELPTIRFTMGSDRLLGEPDDDEGPSREVTVGSLAISAEPISVRTFTSFVDATDFVTVAEREGTGFVRVGSNRQLRQGATWKDPSAKGTATASELPVCQVAWSDIHEFCSWSGTRLLREAEWERCARHGVPEMGTHSDLEWVADYYDAGFFRSEQRVNPTGPTAGTHRVARGGGNPTRRTSFLPDMSANDLTFRVLRT